MMHENGEECFRDTLIQKNVILKVEEEYVLTGEAITHVMQPSFILCPWCNPEKEGKAMKRPDLTKIRELVNTITANTTKPEGEECLRIGRKYYVLPNNMSREKFHKITEELTKIHYQIEEDFLEKAPEMLLDLCAYIEELESRE